MLALALALALLQHGAVAGAAGADPCTVHKTKDACNGECGWNIPYGRCNTLPECPDYRKEGNIQLMSSRKECRMFPSGNFHRGCFEACRCGGAKCNKFSP